jgi:hypothetical protein
MLSQTLSQRPTKVQKKRHGDTPNSTINMETCHDEENKENDFSHVSHGSEEPIAHNLKSESEMGIIEEIYCENFMCHSKLRVTLVSVQYSILTLYFKY